MRIWENRAVALSSAADSPARLPAASSVHPNAPRERHDASEPVSSPLSDQRAVRASRGQRVPSPGASPLASSATAWPKRERPPPVGEDRLGNRPDGVSSFCTIITLSRLM
ncbi:unnamed protein product [Gulo gulo]|uniref:Uncharacterized protein n=1 Tax=Gulo gulo TaxID=48420 RepID=A0A9X9Q6R2_GULGU|nr:unnamed protein product [Gulo gulo]